MQVEVNEAQNLPGKHQEELLSACFAGRREGAVCMSHKGKKLGAPVSPFPRCEEKGSGSRPVLFFVLVAYFTAFIHPGTFSQFSFILS